MKPALIDRIISLQEPPIVTVEGQDYWVDSKQPVKPAIWHPSALQVSSLVGLREFVESNLAELAPESFLHVQGPRSVHLVSPLLGATRERLTYATSTVDPARHTWNNYSSIEDFIIWLSIGFRQDENTAKILRLVSNISDESSVTLADDGITQRATVKTGLVNFETVELPKLIPLRPVRTFSEIEQPASIFMLRLKSVDAGGGAMKAALFSADVNNSWEIEAITSIKQWTRSNIPGLKVVG